MQLTKECLFPAIGTLKDCLEITSFMLESVQVKSDILKDKKYALMFSVEVVNDQVLKGVPFRQAYKSVGNAIEKGNFEAPETINHTHEGSIGNLCNQHIKALMAEKVKVILNP
jgi:argininosuccinate lyase